MKLGEFRELTKDFDDEYLLTTARDFYSITTNAEVTKVVIDYDFGEGERLKPEIILI